MSFSDRKLNFGLISRINRFYLQEVFPRVDHIRGTTRLKVLLEKLVSKELEKPQENPQSIDDFEWDNLVILDGCRHDLYEEVNGETDYRIAAGSMSKDFIRENFSDGDWSDVVYITANPFFSEDHFEALTGRDSVDVFHTIFHTYRNKWDEDNDTVMPGSIVDDVKTAEKLFPDKRKIIHFMQPHHPFVQSDLVDKGFDDIVKEETYEQEWDLAMKGELEREEVAEAYRENLEFVMSHVEELSDILSSKTIITSDHGNYVGEGGLFGHPPGKSSEVLRKVPFDVRD